jgi:hypothetical protein
VEVPNFVDKLHTDIVNNGAYTSVFTFAEAEETYSLTVDEGRIISQDPLPGTQWDGTKAIKLVVSLGAEPVEMPDFTTELITQGDAGAKLNELNLEYSVVPLANAGEYDPGEVVRTDPEAGTMVKPKKDKVVLYVAGDVALIAMPELKGQSQENAEAELKRQGIQYRIDVVENDGTSKAGTVAFTEPPAGNDVATGSTTVNVKIYDVYRLPDLSEHVGKAPDDLYKFLNKRNIAYALRDADNTDPAKNGLIQKLDYIINGEVNSSTVVTIYLYKDAAAPVPEDDDDD